MRGVHEARVLFAGLVVLALGLTSCTSAPNGDVSTMEPRLAPADDLVRPGALSFRLAGLIGMDGQDRMVPDGTLDPAGDRRATCGPGLAIGALLPLSGPLAGFGAPVRDAVDAAITEFADANPGCPLHLEQFDTQGSDAGSLAATTSLVEDASVIGVIGPIFSHEVGLIGDRLTDAGLAFASPSATLTDLAEDGDGFFRGLPNEAQHATAGANYLTARLGLSRICVVAQGYPETDAAAATVRGVIGEDKIACALSIGQAVRNFGEEVGLVQDARAEAVYFAGYSPTAAAFVKQLHAANPDILFMGWEGVLDGPEFVQYAADSGRGTLVVGSFLPMAKHLQDPGTTSSVDGSARYATEGYELATIMTQGIGIGAVADRATMRAFLTDYTGDGPLRRYGWDPRGELRSPEMLLYEVG